MKKNTIIGIIAIIAVIIIAGSTIAKGNKVDTRVAFAECLKNEGVKFYGAFWCPHCNAQKALFGKKATKSLDYIECSTADGKNQTLACQEAKIESYPTWEFKDGVRKNGEQTFEELSLLSGCPVPDGYASDVTADQIGLPEVTETTLDTENTPPEEVIAQ